MTLTEPTHDHVDLAEDQAVAPVANPAVVADADLVDDELLVEEISIDGMCGVY